VQYPAAMIRDENMEIEFKVFRNENHRQRYVEALIKDAKPDFEPPMSREALKDFLTSRKLELNFNTVEMPKNGGHKHWPLELKCPCCESTDILQDGALRWSADIQNWEIEDLGEGGFCLDCRKCILPEEAFIAFTLEP